MNMNFLTCSAQDLYDASFKAHVFHPGTSVAVTRLGDKFHLFDLTGDVETKLDVASTDAERLLAHAQGFLGNRTAKVAA